MSMKFIVNSSVLLRQLSYIDGVVVAKPIIPILNNFLFTITDGVLSIHSTDLETTMSTHINVDAKENVSIAIPSKTTMELLKTLADQPLAFTINEEKGTVEIKYETGRFKLTAQRSDEFPKSPVLEDVNSFNIPAKVLQKAVAKSVFATSNDEIRLNLTGVYVQLFNNNVTFVATDANRLVRFTRNDVKPGVESALILPKKALNLLKSSLPSDDTIVKVTFNQQNAQFQFGEQSLICRLIDDKYPDYKAVIPTENPNRLTVDRADFLMAVKRVSITSNKSTHQIRLKMTPTELTISAEDIDFENESVERMPCSFEGDEMEIGFNSKYFLEMLSNMDASTITIEMSQPNRAGVILPAEQEADEEILMLIMPMMLNNY